MDPLPVLGLVGLLFVKEAGVPVPIPGDLLVLGAGVAASGTGLAAPAELAAILVAGYAGGSLQFAVVRGTFRERLIRLLGRLGVPQSRLDSLADWLRRRGAAGVAVARATPGLRVGAIAASGMADLHYGRAFLPGLVAGNTLFVGGHFALGFLIGAPALALVAGLGGAAALIVALAVLAVVGGVIWMLLRRRAARQGDLGVNAGTAGGGPRDLAGYGAWAEAACPACLAITLYERRAQP
jgi:membrane protein DedA with SNARE-associated domain